MTFQPHDLLWLADATKLLSDEIPAWLSTNWHPGLPVVVRRAAATPGHVAIGIRGSQRSQRLATWASHSGVIQQTTPEQLLTIQVNAARRRCIPALQAFSNLQRQLTDCAWGPTGNTGFELATNKPTLHHGSDLDLLIRCPVAPALHTLRHWLALFARQPCRVDAQLETPHGGLALLEWAAAPRSVMVKTTTGPVLLTDPWAGQPA